MITKDSKFGLVENGEILKYNVSQVKTGLGINSPIETYNSRGWYLIVDAPPILESWQTMSSDYVVDEPSKQIDKVYTVTDKSVAVFAKAKIDELAKKSSEVEVAGIDVDGFEVATDRSTQALLNGAFAHSGRNPNTPFSFKGKNGWGTVDSAEIYQINNMVGEHVRDTFDKEKLLYDAITVIADDAIATDNEKLILLEEFDINVEWDKLCE